MAQVLFATDTTCANADLDANFTELYGKTAWATTGIGYATGAGGAVTQLTSKSTAVTLNKNCGQITMHNASLGATSSINFQVNNSVVAAADVVCPVVVDDFGANYTVACAGVGSGYFLLRVTNFTAGSLAQAVRINFVVIKSVAS